LGGGRGKLIKDEHRVLAVELIIEANNAGARLFKACEVLGISIRTYQRWKNPDGSVNLDKRPLTQRKAPQNKLSDEEREFVLETLCNSEFIDSTPAQIVPTLADAGIYICSESTMYRILREDKMNKHRGPKKGAVKRELTTHVAFGPNEVWSWDITWLKSPVNGLYYKLYLFMDIFSRKIVGWEVWDKECAKLAGELVKRIVINENLRGKPIVCHSDNGAPMKAETLHTLYEKLNIHKSFSRPRVSNDNAYSESLFGTMKYRPNYPQNGFKSLDDAREWVESFVEWYNNVHKHSGLNYVTPAQCHAGQHIEVLNNRRQVYAQARLNRPERWSKSPRGWSPKESATLNPIKQDELEFYKMEKLTQANYF